MELMFISRLRKPIGVKDQDFYTAWLAEAHAAISALDAGRMKFMYKVAGEYKLVGVIEVENAESIDRIIHGLPIFRDGNMDMIESYEWLVLADYRDWASQLEALARPS